MAKNFEDLECWKLAAELDKMAYKLIRSSGIRNDFELRDQMSRSAGSVADNIAEGFERGGNKELIQFLFIAKASCGELRSQFHRALGREHITEEEHLKFIVLCRELSGKLMNFIIANKNSSYTGSKFYNKKGLSNN